MRQLLAGYMKQRGVGEYTIEIVIRQIELENSCLPNFAAAVGRCPCPAELGGDSAVDVLLRKDKLLIVGQADRDHHPSASLELINHRSASDEEIARSIGVGGSTVYRTKRRFVLGNLAAALNEEPRPGARRAGKEEALLVATACSSPPAGRSRWTLELLAGELARLTTHQSVSRETVRRRLAENDLKPWRKDMWCVPQVDAEYVAPD